MKKLKGIINSKITEFETEKSEELEHLNKFDFYSPMDLETINNILICESKIELLNELLEEIE